MILEVCKNAMHDNILEKQKKVNQICGNLMVKY